MNIRLESGYYITSDSNQYKLCRERINKNTGERDLVSFKYYNTLEGLLRGIPEQALKDSEATTLAECIDLLNKIKEEISSKLRI